MGTRSIKRTLFAGIATIAAASFSAGQASASTNDILFILDGSGSMWGQIGGIAKIETAKNTMIKLIDDVPEGARLGFMTYGTTSKDSCQDVALLNTIGSDRTAIKQSITGVRPLGKTPIQTSLVQGISALSKAEPSDVQKSLVLVSDGIETCDGDPCSVALSSQASGVAMKIHVVGFNVDSEARAQLECIAKNGQGQYFDAADTEGFKQAMDAVVKVAQADPAPAPAPEPVVEEPKGPTITEFFRDDFDGEELAEHWAVENANPENFIVENGVLTMISTELNRFSTEKPVNLISYTGDLPKGNWDANITFTAQIPTRGVVDWGLRKDKDNFLSTAFLRRFDRACNALLFRLTKTSGGKRDSVVNMFRGYHGICGGPNPPLGKEDYDLLAADLESKPVTLTISKRGRSYFAKTVQDGITRKDGSPYEPATSEYTSLRTPGTLSFTIGRYNDSVSGEIYVEIDSVVINTVEE